MFWALAAVAVLAWLLWRWAHASPIAGILMIPVAWYGLWLAFLPMEPTRLEWFLSFGGAVVIGGAPCWIRENRSPRVEILPPRH